METIQGAGEIQKETKSERLHKQKPKVKVLQRRRGRLRKHTFFMTASVRENRQKCTELLAMDQSPLKLVIHSIIWLLNVLVEDDTAVLIVTWL